MLKKAILSILFLIFLTISVFADINISIFHFNDTHGRAEENKEIIGFAKIFAYIEQQKKINKNILILDAGDTLHGTNLAVLSKGKAIVDIFNHMQVDAMEVGNHDFNYGFAQLQSLEKNAKFKMLAANVVDVNNKTVFLPSFIKEVSGVKIGIFGLSTPETMYKSHPKNIEGLKFLDISQEAKKQVAFLKSQGAEIIIALGHLGLDEGTKENERSTALAEVEGIDLLIDGHSHTKLENGLQVKNLLIVQTGEHNKNLGRVDITINDKKEKTIKASLLSANDLQNITPDSNIVKIINQYNKEQEQIMAKKITTTTYDLEGSREKVRSGETNLGMLVVDAMKADNNTEVAIINSGGIRNSIKAGDISYKEILSVLPFGNTVVVLDVKGLDLKAALEHSVAIMPEPNGGFLQVSGISFDVNYAKPKGKKVSNVLINGQKLDNYKTYEVAMLDFMAAGGDGYEMFKAYNIKYRGKAIDEVLATFMKNTNLENYKYKNRMKVIK
jgi:5'-nucleotidase/UDP-sugar diphosphatase